MPCFDIVHQTLYQYSEPVAICQNELRMRIRDTRWINCHSCEIEITPHPNSLQTHTDYFGNVVDLFAIETNHQSLCVTVRSRVEVLERNSNDLKPDPLWRNVVHAVKAGSHEEDLLASEFVYRSRRIQPQAKFAEYARGIFEETPTLLAAAERLTKRIHKDFRYDPTATGVDTSTSEAFRLRAGVCQDFSHVQIAALRSLGLPARYVSGYLRTVPPPGKPRLVGSDQSHAWISVYAGAVLGWVDFDPTNACRTGTDHIPVCVGRDYDDISPMRGLVLGGGVTTLAVSVDVAECPDVIAVDDDSDEAE